MQPGRGPSLSGNPLPLTRQPGRRGGEIPRAAGDAPRRAVLLADDNELIRTTARGILEAAGITVLVAVDGADAVRIFSSEPEVFGAAVLDYEMPRMGGAEAFGELRRLRPDLAVILCFSGRQFAEAERFRAQGVAVLTKPFRPTVLVEAVLRSL